MNFIKLTKMDDNFNKNVRSPLAPHIGSLFPTFRAIEPTFPTNIPHNAPKSPNPYHIYASRGRLTPVFQRTRTNLINYIASRIARILPIGDACNRTPFLSHLRTLAYWVHSGGAL
jgi:hypothetical protein